ncbi:MAG: 23S rRNA (adenine(2503)-C(2))-methyltransferase RlmN [Armatimonadetes bacterium]|nr:23S rRNA (adenine(2503)-C(2))-methyltransferase RlmN [Armatimonadota bacterium]
MTVLSSELPALAGLNSQELSTLMVELGEKKMRGRQIANHLYKRFENSFNSMDDLPQAFRTLLESQYRVSPLHVARHLKSRDGVEKLLVHGGDEQVFECVLLPYSDRVSCCLSTQVGCPMGCTFCATGLGGFDRNLSVGEIIGQYLLLSALSIRPISHVVFMGMGEPLLNFGNLLKAIQLLHDEVGISHRRITVSTVGIAPQIRELAKLKLPIHLALSLHSPFDDIRSRLMPVNKKWSVAEIMGEMRNYQRATGRKITIEYLLIAGVNDSKEQALELARLVQGVPSVINLIPWNWVDTGNGFARPTREQVRAFRQILESRGANVTERTERGHDIAAACGQLAGQHQGKFAKRGTPLQVTT